MGRFSKPPDQRQGHRVARVLPISSGVIDRPAAPTDFLRATREAWDEFWSSEIARITKPTQLPMIRRLFARYDERDRAYRAIKKHGRLVAGSQGQPVQNPLLKYIDACDNEIRQLEDRLGLSPRSFAQLGGHYAAAQKSLDDLDDGPDGDEPDPRAQRTANETLLSRRQVRRPRCRGEVLRSPQAAGIARSQTKPAQASLRSALAEGE